MKPNLLRMNRTGLKFLFCLLITFLFFFGTAVSSVNAKVIDWKVAPANPENGDTLIISGCASPEEEVEVSISFEKTVPVYLKEYAYELENIEVLNFKNLLTVKAEGVENLKVKMKMVLSKTESAWAKDGTATVSFSGVSPGKYKVRVEGTAEDGASGVNLRVTSVQKLKAGKDGKFNYIYRTESIPSGKLEIRLGSSEREIIFDTKGKSPVLQTSSTSSQTPESEESEDKESEDKESEDKESEDKESEDKESEDKESEDKESEDRKTSELMALTGTETTDQKPVDRENEEKRSIYLTESSWDENNTKAATAREIPSKESAKEQEGQEHKEQDTIILYLLAGTLAGFGGLLVIRKKKKK
jgi:LPXTG-motif cell wall-anchored protein